jgi:hypothetical protein
MTNIWKNKHQTATSVVTLTGIMEDEDLQLYVSVMIQSL